MASTADSGGPLREYMPDSSRGSQDGANEAARVTNGGAPSTLPSPLTEELGQGAQAPGFTSSEINSSGRPSNGVNGNISRDPSSPSPRNQLTFTTDNRSPTGQASANIPEASSFLALIQAADAQGGGAETITTTPATTSPAADGSRGLNVGSAPAASEGLRDVTISGLHDVTISGADNLNVRRRLFVDSVGSPRGPRRHHGVLSPPVTGGGGGAAGAGAGGGEATRRQAGRRKRLLPSEEERMRAFGESIHWRLEGIETSGKAHELCLDLGSDMRFLKKWLTANNPKTGTSNVEPLSQDPARHLWDIRRHATPTGFKDRSTPGVMPEFPSVPAPGLAGITPGMLPGAYFTGVRDGPSASDPAGRGFSLLQELEAETAAAAGGQQQQRGSMVQAMQEAMEEDAPGGSNPFHWPMGHRPAGYGASSLDYPAHLSGVGYGMGSAAGGTMQGLDFLNFPQLSGRSHRQGAGRGDDPCGMMGASRGLSHRMLMDEGRMLMGQEEAGVEGMGGAGMMGYPQYHHGLEPSPLTRTSSGHIIMPPSHVSMSERAYLQQPSATSFQSLLTAPERTLLEWPDRGLPFDTGPPYGGGGGGGASSAGLTDSMLWTAGLHKDLGGTAKIGGTAGVGGTAMMGSGETPAAGIQAQQQQEGSLEQQGELGGTSRGDGGKLAEAGGGSNGAHAGGARGDGGETRVGMEGSAGEGDGAGAAEGVGGEAALQRSSRLPPWMRKQLEQSGRALGGDPFRVSSPRIASSPFLSSHFSTPLSSPHLPSPSFAPAQTSPFSSPCLSHLPPPRLPNFHRLSISIPPSPPPFGAHSPMGAYSAMGAPSPSPRTPSASPFPSHSPFSGGFPSAGANPPSLVRLSPSVAASNRSRRRAALRAHHLGAHIPGKGRHGGGRGGGHGGSLGSPKRSGRMGHQRMRIQEISGSLNAVGDGMGHGQGLLGQVQQMSLVQQAVSAHVSGSSSGGGGAIGGSRLRPQASLTESEGREVRALCLEPLTRRGSLTRSEGEGSGGSGGSRGTALPRRNASMGANADVAGTADVDGGADMDSKSGGSAGSTPKQLQGVSQDLSPATGTGFRGYGSKSKAFGMLFEKLLTASDTSHLGRIVLPKVPAERFLPHVESKEGILIIVEDSIGGQWCFRYRFWPNNRSRMYVLEHAGDYIRKYGLTAGDTVGFYRSEFGHLMLKEQKAQPTVLAAPPHVASPSLLTAPTTPAPVLALSTNPGPLSAVPITTRTTAPVTISTTPSGVPLSSLPAVSSITQDSLPQLPPPPTASSSGFLHPLPLPHSLLLTQSLPLPHSIDRFQGSMQEQMGSEQMGSILPAHVPLQIDHHLPSPLRHTPRPLRLLSVPSLPRTPTLPPDAEGLTAAAAGLTAAAAATSAAAANAGGGVGRNGGAQGGYRPDAVQKSVGEAGGAIGGAPEQAQGVAERGVAEASLSGGAIADLKEGFEGSWQTAVAMALLPGDRGYEEPNRGFGGRSIGFEELSHGYHAASGCNVQDQGTAVVGQLQLHGDLVGGVERGGEKGMERGGRAMDEAEFTGMGPGLGETEAERPAHMGNHLDALMEDAEAEEALGLHQQPLQCMAPPLPTTGVALERCSSLSTTEKCLEMLDADSARGH